MSASVRLLKREIRGLAVRAPFHRGSRTGAHGPGDAGGLPVLRARLRRQPAGGRKRLVPCRRGGAFFFRADRGVGRTGIDSDFCRGIERMRFALRFLHHRRVKLESAGGRRF